jgi:threonine dehydrogenase-like Zn-dependent dehydrogenase
MAWEPSRALVLGAGPLGILTAFLLRIRGFDVHSVATRPHDSPKAKLLESVGVKYVNGREEALEGLGRFDLIFEETGVAGVAAEGAELLGTNGVMCLLGIYDYKEVSYDLGKLFRGMVLRNMTLFGSVNANKRYFQAGAQDFAEIKTRYPDALRGLITRVFPPEEYPKAYRPDSEDEIKTVIDFE